MADDSSNRDIRKELKQHLAKFDFDDRGVMHAMELADLIDSFGIDLTQDTRIMMEQQTEEVNYRLWVESLQKQTDGRWKYMPLNRKPYSVPVHLTARNIHKSEDNAILGAQDMGQTVRSQDRQGIGQRPTQYAKLYAMLSQQGVDTRKLSLLPYVFKRNDCDKIEITTFESTLKDLKTSLPESSIVEIILTLQIDGYITLDSVRQLINESKFIANPMPKNSDNMNQVMNHGFILPSPELQRNLNLLLEKLGTKYRMLREFFLHFDRQKKGRITQEQFENGLSSLMIFLNKKDIETLFRYLDKNNKGYIVYQDFWLIKNEAKKPVGQVAVRSLENPHIRYNSVKSVKPKFNDLESEVGSIDSRSRQALYFGKQRAGSPIPSDVNPNYSYGINRTQVSDSIDD